MIYAAEEFRNRCSRASISRRRKAIDNHSGPKEAVLIKVIAGTFSRPEEPPYYYQQHGGYECREAGTTALPINLHEAYE